MASKRVIRRIALFSMKKNWLLLLTLSFLLVLIGCTQAEPTLSSKVSVIYTKEREAVPIEPTPFTMNNQINHTSIAVVGDLMFHNTQLTRAYNSATGSFDFSTIFTFIEPYLKQPDLLFGNLETTFYGPYGSTTSVSDQNVYGYSGYPMFNTPDSALVTIKEAGFDFLSTANNHSLDRRALGMYRTIEKLDALGIMHTGTFLTVEDKVPYELVEQKGITFAVVNYTYSTNGIILKDEEMKLINSLNNYEDAAIQRLYEDVVLASQSEADFVIVMMHYGNEYKEFEDRRFQKPITENLLRSGADIVFGGHPHVLQPMEIYTELDGVVFDEPKIVIYSLGNFIASQRNVQKMGGNTDLGVVFHVYFEQINDQKPTVSGVGFLPTYTIWQPDTIMTIPINEEFHWNQDQVYYYGLEKNTPLNITAWDRQRIDFAKTYTLKHLMSYESQKTLLGELFYHEGIYRYNFQE